MMIRLGLESLAIAIVLTGISYLVGIEAGWIAELNWLEIFSVATSYSCTYLCVKQSRLNYPIGMISVAALSFLFYQQGLYSSMMLNMYLFPMLLWGWFRWGKDDNTRPVTFVEQKWWPVYVALTAGIFAIISVLMTYMGAKLVILDSTILAVSILAQMLLDQKKIETWSLWIIVNIISIITYWQAGLPLISMQYVFFLVNTVYGAISWSKTMKPKAAV
jgi:nicotinamide mononucleotide transporter